MSTLNYLGLSGLKKVFNIIKSYVDNNHMREVTWAELKDLRDNGKLIPGQKYRITDYQCTTTQEDSESAGHQFDIIVTALSSNTLSEEAGAVLHEGDTYFSNCNLSAWKLWYCLDNNADKFTWADKTNGKGVIYRMIDEWGNEATYDFKNILFMWRDSYGVFDLNGNAYGYLYTFASTSASRYYGCADTSLSGYCGKIFKNTTINYGITTNYLGKFCFIGTNNTFTGFYRSTENGYGGVFIYGDNNKVNCTIKYTGCVIVSGNNNTIDGNNIDTIMLGTLGSLSDIDTQIDARKCYNCVINAGSNAYFCLTGKLYNPDEKNTNKDNYRREYVYNYIVTEGVTKLFTRENNEDTSGFPIIYEPMYGERTQDADENKAYPIKIISINSQNKLVEYCEADYVNFENPLTDVSEIIGTSRNITSNGTYKLRIKTIPNYPSDIKSTVWSLPADKNEVGDGISINSSTGEMTVAITSSTKDSANATVQVDVTTDSSKVFTATKQYSFDIKSILSHLLKSVSDLKLYKVSGGKNVEQTNNTILVSDLKTTDYNIIPSGLLDSYAHLGTPEYINDEIQSVEWTVDGIQDYVSYNIQNYYPSNDNREFSQCRFKIYSLRKTPTTAITFTVKCKVKTNYSPNGIESNVLTCTLDPTA